MYARTQRKATCQRTYQSESKLSKGRYYFKVGLWPYEALKTEVSYDRAKS